MKFIACPHNKIGDCPFDIYVMPDTALHINKRPFFIPDYASPCLMYLHRAVRICRLGRCISQRFASRYYDAATLCARMEAPTLPPEVGRTFDECVSVGEWIPTEQCADAESLQTEADRAIAEVSQYYTLRQGDVILLDIVREPENVQINQHIDETYNGTQVLQFNIK